MSTLAMLRNSVTAALPQPLPGHDEGPDFPVFSRRVGAFDLAVTVGFEPMYRERSHHRFNAVTA